MGSAPIFPAADGFAIQSLWGFRQETPALRARDGGPVARSPGAATCRNAARSTLDAFPTVRGGSARIDAPGAVVLPPPPLVVYPAASVYVIPPPGYPLASRAVVLPAIQPPPVALRIEHGHGRYDPHDDDCDDDWNRPHG